MQIVRVRLRRDIRHIPLRRGAHRRPRVVGTDDASQPERPEERHRRAGGPEDKALYTCTCGYQFDAAVSASVQCPHCGQGQAW
jgi:hypothetical protein